MLRVNVGMSRKVSKDYNSTGFSINLEGEIALSLDDPQVAVERIKEFYDLAEESLALQIDRYDSITAIASRDEETSFDTEHVQPSPTRRAIVNKSSTSESTPAPRVNRNEASTRPTKPVSTARGSDVELATNKQLQFLVSLGKRHKMTTKQLEDMAVAEFGPIENLYDLTKQQAGALITSLNESPSAARR